MKVYKRTERDAKRADREVRKGQKLYVIKQVATNLAPYEDSHLYSEYTVSHRHPLMPGWMISGSLSVEGLVLREGPVYTEKPKGIRNIADPGPQVAGPLDPKKKRHLDAREIREIEQQNLRNDQATGRNKRGWW